MHSSDEKQQVLRLLQSNEPEKAEVLLDRLLKTNPADYESMVQLAFIANRRGQFAIAISHLQSAAYCNPRSADIHFYLGQVWKNCGRVNEAVDSFHKAIDFRSDFPEAYVKLAETLMDNYRHQELITVCREALERYPKLAELRCKLAVGLEQGHMLEEARAEIGEVLRIDPGHPRAMLTLARIEKRCRNFDRAREVLESLQHNNLAPLQLSAVLVELGNVLDLMGEFTGAYAAYQRSNEVVLDMLGPAYKESATVLTTIEHYRSTLTRAFMQNWMAEEPDDNVPSPVFLVGFPRSGTTLTEQIITASGGFEPTDEEAILPRLLREIPTVIERPFLYPDELNTLDSKEITALRRHYWKLAEEMIGTRMTGKRLLDKLPLNLGEIGFIYRLFPSAPIVVVLRDPRDSCLSCFMHSFAPSRPMNNFLTLEGTARFYAKLMDFWLHMRAAIRAPYREIRYEDLVADLEGTARPLIEHIGGTWSDSILHYFEHRRRRAVRTPSYSDVSQPIFSHAAGRWRNYASSLDPIMKELHPFIKEFGYID